MELFFFTRGGCASCLRACLGARLLPQSYQYPNLSEGADRDGGQLGGDKECPFSGVTKSGRVRKKVPESDARSVQSTSSRRVPRLRAVNGNLICTISDISSGPERPRLQRVRPKERVTVQMLPDVHHDTGQSMEI